MFFSINIIFYLIKVILEFLDFLETWQTCTNKPFQFTSQTQTSLFVSLKGALELSEYLCGEVGYSYLMTRRINQDALEVSNY